MAVLRHAEEVTGNVALTCRYYGISRTCFYKWQRRYQDEGLEGLRDRSSKPHHCPHATEAPRPRCNQAPADAHLAPRAGGNSTPVPPQPPRCRTSGPARPHPPRAPAGAAPPPGVE
ncbi:helix-turn-helix domain-containing protein [Streptomyces sp. NPDC054901]